jgi:hypothetical protein
MYISGDRGVQVIVVPKSATTIPNLIPGDESKPECSNCKHRDEPCEWGLKLIFKDGNATSLGEEHPSMLEGSRKRPRRFEVSLTLGTHFDAPSDLHRYSMFQLKLSKGTIKTILLLMIPPEAICTPRPHISHLNPLRLPIPKVSHTR